MDFRLMDWRIPLYSLTVSFVKKFLSLNTVPLTRSTLSVGFVTLNRIRYCDVPIKGEKNKILHAKYNRLFILYTWGKCI